MAADLTTIIQFYKKCGCKTIDVNSVKVGRLCLSTNPELSDLTEWGEQIDITQVISVPEISLDGLSNGDDEGFQAESKIPHANSTTYTYGTAKAAVYNNGADAYLAYIYNPQGGKGDMRTLLHKMFYKLVEDEGKTVFYFTMNTLRPPQIDIFESDWGHSVVGTHELYEE